MNNFQRCAGPRRPKGGFVELVNPTGTENRVAGPKVHLKNVIQGYARQKTTERPYIILLFFVIGKK